jgi:hypothetical protein
MKEITAKTLANLRKVRWFRHVGRADTSKAMVLGSWESAVLSATSLEWENLCLEAANRYRMRLLERDRERFGRWNTVVEEVKPHSEALVEEKLWASDCADTAILEALRDTVRWDILHLCMEAEYADVYPPGFYASQAYWYQRGRFPCGWQRDFPEGKLVIY